LSAERPSRAATPLIVAELLRPHGVCGEMMAKISGIEPALLGGLRLEMEERNGVRAAALVRNVRQGGGGWIVAIEGVDDRDRAEELRGARLLASREDLPPPGPGEWWIADLVGLRVVGENGEDLGVLEEVLKLPANDVFVVRGAGGEILVPVLEGVVLDIVEGTMRIAIPAGLLDAPRPEAPEDE
jgi:16S rRNA processing protein RimM